tara:strand:- start:2494 stop:3186 length:693 start_codon:yes stop_codon:yes gene_type:complete
MAKRVNFSLIKSKYNSIGKSNVRLTQSSLFLTQDIDATKSTYDFDVLENQTATLTNDQIRLNINDEFVVTHFGVYLYGTWTVSNEGVKIGTGTQLLTYSPIELDGSVIVTKNLYAGQLKIAVNNVVYLEKWDLRKCEYIPRTQFNSQLAATNVAAMASNDFSENALIAFEPMLTLSGAKKNDISIRLPQSIAPSTITWLDQKGNTISMAITKIGVRMLGLNAQNGAKFQG